MTRVLQLCCDPGIGYGAPKGAAVHQAELARAFVGEGAEVLLAVPGIAPGAPPAPPGVTVEVMPGPGRGAPVAHRLAAEPARRAWLTDRLRSWRADVLHERIALHTTAGLEAARAADIPHLVELNAPLPAEAARYRCLEDPVTADRLERRVLAGSDVVLAVSRPLAAYAERRGARRVEVLPNAVDPRHFPEPASAGDDPPVVVFTGSLRPWHGVGTLADAWLLLGDRAPRLVVVGDGTGRDRLVAAGALVTGTVPHAAVPGLLAGAQIGIVPHPPDAPDYFSPLKLFEYLAAGLAVVAADLPGVVDVTGGAAVLVPPGNVRALAGAVAGLAADPERRTALGAAGRAAVFERHTWADRARSILWLAGLARRATSDA